MSETPERYEGPGPNSDAFDPKQHLWDGKNWWSSDLRWWWDGERWQSRDVPQPKPPAAQRKPRPPGYWRDFWLGFGGTVAGNIVLAIVLQALASASLGDPVNAIILAAPWVLNIGALIAFAIIRSRVAIGMLAAYGAALSLVLLGGCLFAVICFSGGVRMP